MSRSLAELAREALMVQDACNIGGVARSFAQAMVDLMPHCTGTDQRNTHPITIVWLDKMNSLARIQGWDDGGAIMRAFEQVRELADAQPPVVVDRTQHDHGREGCRYLGNDAWDCGKLDNQEGDHAADR